jgi:DnaD/phage-associated family protein
VALALLEYCFTVGKTTTSYIKTVARDWVKQEIDTFEKASQYIKQLEDCKSAEREFARLVKIKEVPDKYKCLLNKWLFEFGFSQDVLYKAYQTTLEETGQLRWKYMDKVLTTWSKHGVGNSDPNHAKHKQAGEFSAKVQVKSKTNDTSAPSSFDLDELELQIQERQRKRISEKKGIALK